MGEGLFLAFGWCVGRRFTIETDLVLNVRSVRNFGFGGGDNWMS